MPNEDNGEQNLNESNKYKKDDACSYGHKLVCVDDTFSKLYKSYLSEDAVYNFIKSMVEENKNCSAVMKKHFNKQFEMTGNDSEAFKNSSKCRICDNDYGHDDIKLRDHCHVTRKYRDSEHRDCNIKFN